ncbi:MAG: SDR family NAD(P)-dependent oxidoreductase [Alphaproteobacteria bacterium]|nr:SDR family NAD(P)-dependent oxidoreductase [Alphaproteobacteria bacterium]
MTDLSSFPDGFRALVIGASGGIGAALVTALDANPGCAAVHGLSRRAGDGHGFIDLDDEDSIAAAAQALTPLGPFHLIINATGQLHGDEVTPEKTWRHLEADRLLAYYRANCVGPALVAKHFLPLLAKPEKAVFAALSARVGSIADNHVGGWHGYRAAKAALNMMIRNFAIELKLKTPTAIVIGLHPGTVETALSAPFRGMVKHEVFTPETAAGHLLSVINRAGAEDSGHQLAWDGQVIAG